MTDEIFERSQVLGKRTRMNIQVKDGQTFMELETFSRDYDEEAGEFPMMADYDGPGYQVFELSREDVNQLAQLFSLAFVSVIEQQVKMPDKKPVMSFDTTEPKAEVI